VVDYKLPEMNGLDLLVELRNRKIDLPAILITTNPSAEVRRRTALAGVTLIEKPLLNDALFQGIRAALTTRIGAQRVLARFFSQGRQFPRASVLSLQRS
jgi:FixJ family two-component response regulator